MNNKINVIELFGLNDETLINKLKTVYQDEIKLVNENYINSQVQKIKGNKTQIAALPAKTVGIFLPLEDKSTDSKIKYILWKESSVCEVLKKAGYKKCNDDCNGCNRCKVQYNCASALRRAITEEVLE